MLYIIVKKKKRNTRNLELGHFTHALLTLKYVTCRKLYGLRLLNSYSMSDETGSCPT